MAKETRAGAPAQETITRFPITPIQSKPWRPELLEDLRNALAECGLAGALMGIEWSRKDPQPLSVVHAVDAYLGTLQKQAYPNLLREKGARQALESCALFVAGVTLSLMDAARKSQAVFLWARVQGCLTRALTQMPTDASKILYEAGSGALEDEGWRTHCRGAMSVARVIKTLHQLSVATYLPSTTDDLRCKVDLYAGPLARNRGLYMQVKTDASGQPYFSIINARPSGYGKKARTAFDTHTRTSSWEGAAKLNQKFGLDWIPAAFHTGKPVDADPWSFGSLDPLKSALENLVLQVTRHIERGVALNTDPASTDDADDQSTPLMDD